jgi:hypothetical protein
VEVAVEEVKNVESQHGIKFFAPGTTKELKQFQQQPS